MEKQRCWQVFCWIFGRKRLIFAPNDLDCTDQCWKFARMPATIRLFCQQTSFGMIMVALKD